MDFPKVCVVTHKILRIIAALPHCDSALMRLTLLEFDSIAFGSSCGCYKAAKPIP